jgi:thiol-disulfide isomerase/thioredoxin
MLQRITLVLSLFACVFTMIFSQPASAFFFGKKKTASQQAVEPVKDETANKVLVVEIFAGWCPACKSVQPTLDLLQKEETEIEFVQLDVSTPSKAAKSLELATTLQIADFYKLNKSKTSTVAIFSPGSRKLISLFQNNTEIDDYTEAIREAYKPESVE